nr:hypothetical protein [uncultured Prevotella sp.]
MQEKGMFFYIFSSPQKNYCPSFLPLPTETNIPKISETPTFSLQNPWIGELNPISHPISHPISTNTGNFAQKQG